MAERRGRPERRRSATGNVQQSPRGGRIRCAIYTRKSSEEGLEQEFNSLDAQREACEAYVRSQKHEGWQVLAALYDDPGFSGGNMERPALKRLLADIGARKVDVVVVYKVDRLTRSLADFAKIVEVFDANAASFVSVTQAFNTTTSMGRLTLNVLLSFAQFEREVTGERIRDKIAASKKKGLWMGGQPSLGYDVKDRKLIVNEAEAETVRAIFRRYLELGSVRALKTVLDAEGVVSKRRTAADGSAYGGQSFSRGALYQMLQNRVYRGEIVHKGSAYPGEHPPISTRSFGGRFRKNWRPTGSRGGARAMKRSSPICFPAFCLTPRRDGAPRAKLALTAAADIVRAFITEGDERIFGLLRPLIVRAQVHLDRIDVDLGSDRLADALLGGRSGGTWLGPSRDNDREADAAWSVTAGDPVIRLTIPAELRRAGMEMKFILDGADDGAPPDAALVRLLARAHSLARRLAARPSSTLEEIGAQEKMGAPYAARLMRLNFLAPDIVVAILNGKQPVALTASKLMADTRLPPDWSEQRKAMGFA